MTTPHQFRTRRSSFCTPERLEPRLCPTSTHPFVTAGDPDTSFGLFGWADLPHPTEAPPPLAPLPDGKFLLVATDGQASNSHRFAITRLNPDGTPATRLRPRQHRHRLLRPDPRRRLRRRHRPRPRRRV